MSSEVFAKIRELKQAERYLEAWDFGYNALSNDLDNFYLKRSLFWVGYAAIKVIQDRVKDRESKNPTTQEHECVNAWLGRIVILDMPIPCEELDYRFFNLFRGCGEHYVGFIRFVLKFGNRLFRREDFQPYITDSGESPSLVTRTARQVAKGWLTHKGDGEIQVEPVLALLTLAESKAADKDKTWINYDYAKCLIAEHRFEEARVFVLPVLRKKLSESWAWGALAATYYTEDSDAAIACYCKGISEAHEPGFSVKLRLGLTQLLAKAGSFEMANASLNSLLEIYQAKGWAKNSAHEKLLSASWYDSTTQDQEGLNDFIASKAETAINLASGETETLIGIVDSHHRSGKGFNVFVKPGQKPSVRKGVFKGDELPEIGSWIEIVCSADTDELEVFEANPTQEQSNENVEWTQGEMKINPKGFAFVNDTFVAPHLVNPKWDGEKIKVLQVFDINPKKGLPSWRAIKLAKLVD